MEGTAGTTEEIEGGTIGSHLIDRKHTTSNRNGIKEEKLMEEALRDTQETRINTMTFTRKLDMLW